MVLVFLSDQHRATPVDVFVNEPVDFEAEYERALVKELAPGRPVRFLRRETLIRLKREAGRPHDLADVQQLELLGDETP